MGFLRSLVRSRNAAIFGAAGGTTWFFGIRDDGPLSQLGLVRFSRAGWTAVEMIADYKWQMTGTDRESEEYKKRLSGCHQRGAERILELCRKNGGVFIKVGQHIASLQYLIPDEYTSTLSVLHSKAPESKFSEIREVFESSIGKKLEDVFASFDPEPIGAASLAQVHKAKLRASGEEVAVKIQHPKVLKRSNVDVKTMEFFVRVADALFPDFRFMWLVDETKKNLPKELDFLHEAKNAEDAKRLFAHLPFLAIPRIYYELSAPKVLTMEFMEGRQINDVDYFRKHEIDTFDICRKLGTVYSEMIFLRGKIHADPHPGNLLVQKMGRSFRLILLDHGLYSTLTDAFRTEYCKFWTAIIQADKDEIQRICDRFGLGDLYGLFACIVTARSWASVTSGISKSKETEAEAQEIKHYAASLVPQITQVLDRMPRAMLLILKTNDLLRSIERRLGAYGRSDAFLEMSKICTKVVYQDRIRNAKTFGQWTRAAFGLYFTLLKITLYQWYLITKEWVHPKRPPLNYAPIVQMTVE
ncbi:ABC1 domain-containing protein [Aphelenchoides fujianensis]|nr:ABC1 domain-containing protein [Aphelenchoides fujianensis]